MNDAPPGTPSESRAREITPDLPFGKPIPEYPPALPSATGSLCPVASTSITVLDPLRALGIAEAGIVIHFLG